MSVQDTSRQAYRAVKPKLSSKQKKVLRVIERLGPVCNTEIAFCMEQPINRICSRVKELRKLGKIIDDGIRQGPYNRLVHFWRVIETERFLFEN